MELLEGEALAERLRRGPLSVAETVPIGLGMLAALSALHARGDRPSRPQAVERVPDAARREAARLRPGAAASSEASLDTRHRRSRAPAW